MYFKESHTRVDRYCSFLAMKTSDSKNSLAELNPDEPTCFICLEEGNQDFPLIQSSLLRSCGCKFFVHADCWNTWRKDKSDYDCPYCSRRSLHISIPMTAPFQQNYAVHLTDEQTTFKRKIIKTILVLVCFFGIAGPLVYSLIHSSEQ